MKNKKYTLLIIQIAIYVMFLLNFYIFFIVKAKNSIYIILSLVVFFVLMILMLIFWIVKLRNIPNEIDDKKINFISSNKIKLSRDEKILIILRNITLYYGNRINKDRRFASYSNIIYRKKLIVTNKRLIIPRKIFGFDLSYSFYYNAPDLRNYNPFKNNYLISHLSSSKNIINIPIQFNRSHTTYKIFTTHYKEILDIIQKYRK